MTPLIHTKGQEGQHYISQGALLLPSLGAVSIVKLLVMFNEVKMIVLAVMGAFNLIFIAVLAVAELIHRHVSISAKLT